MHTPQALERIVEFQIAEIKRQVEVIDRRLSELGDSEEDRVETILLEAAKRHLLEDLKALMECESRKRVLAPPAVSRTVVEA